MTANELADYLDNNIEAMIMSEQPYLDQAATMLRQQQAEIEALKKAIIEYADCVGSMEGTDFIGDLKYMGTSQESIALLYKLNGYDENGRWIHTKKASEK